LNNIYFIYREFKYSIFYDYKQEDKSMSWEELLAFQIDAGSCFVEAYVPIAERGKEETYTPEQKYGQEIRRGRYVEFNLLHDRGTHFGIRTKGRTESILMSLPSTVRWDYDFHTEKGSEEAKLIEVLMNPQDWL
jgi:coproporphyrinogen III oxidase